MIKVEEKSTKCWCEVTFCFNKMSRVALLECTKDRGTRNYRADGFKWFKGAVLFCLVRERGGRGGGVTLEVPYVEVGGWAGGGCVDHLGWKIESCFDQVVCFQRVCSE